MQVGFLWGEGGGGGGGHHPTPPPPLYSGLGHPMNCFRGLVRVIVKRNRKVQICLCL